MTIKIKSLTLGPFASNAYLIADAQSGNAILLDPVDDAPAILAAARKENWTIKLMIATHAHLDHVLASAPIKQELNIPFLIHEECERLLDEIPMQGIFFGLGDLPAAAKPDRLLSSESEIIELDSIRLQSLYTPGHAPGHLSFYLAEHKILFSGDTLFAGSIGRTDLPGGDHALLMRSIIDKLMVLDDEVQVLPGHMGITSIGRERATNPFLRPYDNDRA